MVDLNQFQDFLPLISGAIGGAASAGVFKGPIQTLQDWWYVNFGHNTSDQAALLKAKQEANVEKLKRDMLAEVDQIPIENIQEPKLKILGPALEASRYYIDEDELRSMFAKIIASSLDKRSDNKLHSSFVEVVKQLDVLDATILKHLSDKNYYQASPIPAMKMVVEYESGGTKTIFPLIYFTEPNQMIDACAPALYNLDRLGIIKIDDDRWVADETCYSGIENNISIRQVLEAHPEMKLKMISFSITPFGANFISICL